jgi:chemotaxis protein MotB
MKNSLTKPITTILPLSILAFVAATGWYFYYSEVNKNQSLTTDSQSEQGILNNQLEKQQTTIAKLKDDQTALQARLAAEKQSRQELADRLEKTRAEKVTVETNLQREINKATLTTAELETELEKRQATINKLLEDKTVLQARLTEEKQSRQELADKLEKTRAEKMAAESDLQGEIKKVTLTTAELEAELEKRQAVQQSLHDEINTISGEKSQLLTQLEHEQKGKQQIANLKNRIQQELNESRVEILLLKNQMTVIKLTSEVLFSSGSAQIKPAGQKVLSIIAESLNAYPDRAVSVEGHTDNLPIRNARYQSNWELSAARGLAAVKFFEHNADVDPGRLKIVGYGQHHPVSSNKTAEGRKRNRRIEIRIMPPEITGSTRN